MRVQYDQGRHRRRLARRRGGLVVMEGSLRRKSRRPNGAWYSLVSNETTELVFSAYLIWIAALRGYVATPNLLDFVSRSIGQTQWKKIVSQALQMSSRNRSTDNDSDSLASSVDPVADSPGRPQRRLPVVPVLYRNILKCGAAYFIASLFTFSPLLSGIISDITSYGEQAPSPSGHMVATVLART